MSETVLADAELVGSKCNRTFKAGETVTVEEFAIVRFNQVQITE